MEIPNLNDVIKALECEEWKSSVCKKCIYGLLDDHGDYPIWTCNEDKKINEALFYLKLYQKLIKEKENKNE